MPRTDTYIEKDSQINDEIDRLRLAATSSLLSPPRRADRRVGLVYLWPGRPGRIWPGDRQAARGRALSARLVLRELVEIFYERNDMELRRGKFRVRGDTLEMMPAYADLAYRVEFFGDEVERITEIDPLTGEVLRKLDEIEIFPAKHFITPQDKLTEAISRSRRAGGAAQEVQGRGEAAGGAAAGAAHALRPRDAARGGLLLGHRELQPASGAAPAGSRPFTLLDYFPETGC
jgi:excinuclease ABC subunit B